MPSDLGKIQAKQRTGKEPFRNGTTPIGFDLHSFWRWSCSDLVSNATRGVLAEYIVAQALGITVGVREEWDAYDLVTGDGIKVEAKSSAFLQSWHQEKLSAISFQAPRTRALIPGSNKYAEEAVRQADVYVFALLAHKDQATVDPMDVSQWKFFVVPTSVLNDIEPNQESFALSSIRKLTESVTYSDLGNAVRNACAS